MVSGPHRWWQTGMWYNGIMSASKTVRCRFESCQPCELGCSSSGRASAFGAEGSGFDPHRPIKYLRMKESSFFTTLLLVAFIVLKLCGVIAWSWWWVMAPAWIPLVVTLSLLAAYLMFYPMFPALKKWVKWCISSKKREYERQAN